MRTSNIGSIIYLRRLATVLATLIISLAFGMVTSANAAPLDNKDKVKDKVKIEMIDEIDEIDEVDEVEEIEEDLDKDKDLELDKDKVKDKNKGRY